MSNEVLLLDSIEIGNIKDVKNGIEFRFREFLFESVLHTVETWLHSLNGKDCGESNFYIKFSDGKEAFRVFVNKEEGSPAMACVKHKGEWSVFDRCQADEISLMICEAIGDEVKSLNEKEAAETCSDDLNYNEYCKCLYCGDEFTEKSKNISTGDNGPPLDILNIKCNDMFNQHGYCTVLHSERTCVYCGDEFPERYKI